MSKDKAKTYSKKINLEVFQPFSPPNIGKKLASKFWNALLCNRNILIEPKATNLKICISV